MKNLNATETPIIIPAQAMGPTDWLTQAEAAGHLRLAESTLAKMRVYGTGPHYAKAGRSVRYRRDDLDAWMAGRRTSSTTDADCRLPKRLADAAEPQHSVAKMDRTSVH